MGIEYEIRVLMVQECEVCGKNSTLMKARIEGTILDVCARCSQFGHVLEPSREQAGGKDVKKIQLSKTDEKTFILVQDYAQRIKHAREKRGITQEEVGKAIAEKVSLIQKIEAGRFEPPLSFVKKLEHFFGISLIENTGEAEADYQTRKDEPLTFGDLLKKKNEKA